MPNYCYNSLSIEGPNDTLAKIHDFVRGEKSAFDFEKIVPMPADVEDWYEWNCKNWGTKWNSCDAHCHCSSNSLSYDFDTAWGPCEPVIKVLAAMFPDAKILFSYFEPGWGFCGKQEYENGRMIYSAEGNYCEHWFDNYDEDDEDEKEILKEKDSQGIFCSVTNEKNYGPATTYNFSYRDTDGERSIIIVDGFCCDARAERTAFCW